MDCPICFDACPYGRSEAGPRFCHAPLLEVILENTDSHVAYLDRDFNFVRVNSTYVDGCGHSRAELIGHNHFELFPDEQNRAIFERVRDTGEPVRFREKPFQFPDRPERGMTYWDWTLSPVKNTEGEVQGMVLSLADVTEHVRAREALRASEERFRVAISHTGMVFFSQDRDLRYTWVHNPHPSFSAEDTLGRTDDELLPAEDAARLSEIKQRVLDSGEGARDVFRTTIEGLHYFYELVVEPARDAGGEVVGILGSASDITARRQAEERREATLQRMEHLLRVSANVLASGTVDEILKRVVDGARELTGAAIGAVGHGFADGSFGAGSISWSPDRSIQPSGKALSAARLEAYHLLGQGAESVRIGEQALREMKTHLGFPDGLTPIRGLLAASLVGTDCRPTGLIMVGDRDCGDFADEDDAVLRQLCTLTSLALQHVEARAEAQLRAKETEEGKRILDALMTHIPEGIAIAEGPEVTIRMTSAYGQQMIGRHPDETEDIPALEQGTRWNLLCSDGSPVDDNDLPLARAARRGEVVTNQELMLKQPDGTTVPVSCSSGPILDQKGKITGAVMAWRDITERKRFEQALVEADRRKDEFLALLAHELRNPLAPLVSAARILKRAPDRVDLRSEALSVIESQTWHMVRLVDDLLDVSRITRGKIRLQKAPVDLALGVESAVAASRPLIEEHGHQLMVSMPPGPISLYADATRLTQVLSNLLNNAAKYTPSSGSISLEATMNDDAQVEIRVRDNGVGIPAEALPHVFDMFTQVEATVLSSKEGLGVGLALARALTEMHGGSITAHSAGEGQGSEFVVRLPVITPPEIEPRPSDPETHAVPRGELRVLVVDDNVQSARSLGQLLELMGHEVIVAHDGPRALEAAREKQLDVVVLDIGMPQIDGYEVARRLRERFSSEELMVVGLTGLGKDEDRRRAIEAGFDHHLIKPARPGELEDLLSRFQERHRRS